MLTLWFHCHFIEKSTEVHASSGLQQDPDKSQQKPSSEGVVEHDLDPAVTSATCSTEVDLKDPNKYCALCTASFTNPHVALQHYSGRKHQRNQARQELLKQLGHNVEQGNFLPLSKQDNTKSVKSFRNLIKITTAAWNQDRNINKKGKKKQEVLKGKVKNLVETSTSAVKIYPSTGGWIGDN